MQGLPALPLPRRGLFAVLAFAIGASVAVGFLALVQAVFVGEGTSKVSLFIASEALASLGQDFASGPASTANQLKSLWILWIYEHSNFLYFYLLVISAGGIVLAHFLGKVSENLGYPLVTGGAIVWAALIGFWLVVSEESRAFFLLPLLSLPFVLLALLISKRVFAFLVRLAGQQDALSRRHLALYGLPLTFVALVPAHYGMALSLAIASRSVDTADGNGLDPWALYLAGGTLMAAVTWLLILGILRRTPVVQSLVCAAVHFPLASIVFALAFAAVSGGISLAELLDGFQMQDILTLFDPIGPLTFLLPNGLLLALVGVLVTLGAYAMSSSAPPRGGATSMRQTDFRQAARR